MHFVIAAVRVVFPTTSEQDEESERRVAARPWLVSVVSVSLTVVDVSDGADVEMRLGAHEGGEVRQDRASED
jgi:hypothetical protein